VRHRFWSSALLSLLSVDPLTHLQVLEANDIFPSLQEALANEQFSQLRAVIQKIENTEPKPPLTQLIEGISGTLALPNNQVRSACTSCCLPHNLISTSLQRKEVVSCSVLYSWWNDALHWLILCPPPSSMPCKH
jgi:hypothetical protein